MRRRRRTGTTVRVTRADMRRGEPGDHYCCAVALALRRATGDENAHVYTDWGIVRLEVWSRSVEAPADVTRFVWHYDDLPRKPDGGVVLPRKPDDDLRPPTFALPPGDDPEWDEQCSGCEGYRKPAELDDDGLCADCREERGR